MVCVRKCMCVVFTQQKNGLRRLCCRSMKSQAASTNSSSHRLHPLLRQRPRVLDPLLADPAPARVLLRVVLVVAQQWSTPRGPNRSRKFGKSVLGRVVRVLRLLLGVQVVEVAEELVEAVHRRQELVPVAEVVLAELPGRVAERLEELGDRRVLRPAGRRRARQPDLAQAGAEDALAR